MGLTWMQSRIEGVKPYTMGGDHRLMGLWVIDVEEAEAVQAELRYLLHHTELSDGVSIRTGGHILETECSSETHEVEKSFVSKRSVKADGAVAQKPGTPNLTTWCLLESQIHHKRRCVHR